MASLEGLELRLNRWLRDERGIAEPRRVARVDDETILVSKFEPGFAARLHEVLARLPELFDAGVVAERFAGRAGHLDGCTSRVACWHGAMLAMLAELGEARAIGRVECAQVGAGIDSVAAFLDTILWSSPALRTEPPVVEDGETAAYRDAVARMDADPSIFTRHYGRFEDRDVVNHCPGAPFARVLLAQAWTACTGSEPPA